MNMKRDLAKTDHPTSEDGIALNINERFSKNEIPNSYVQVLINILGHWKWQNSNFDVYIIGAMSQLQWGGPLLCGKELLSPLKNSFSFNLVSTALK